MKTLLNTAKRKAGGVMLVILIIIVAFAVGCLCYTMALWADRPPVEPNHGVNDQASRTVEQIVQSLQGTIWFFEITNAVPPENVEFELEGQEPGCTNWEAAGIETNGLRWQWNLQHPFKRLVMRERTQPNTK